MGLLNIIRRMALREKLPPREIARRTGMSRKTIKKYLDAGTIGLVRAKAKIGVKNLAYNMRRLCQSRRINPNPA